MPTSASNTTTTTTEQSDLERALARVAAGAPPLSPEKFERLSQILGSCS